MNLHTKDKFAFYKNLLDFKIESLGEFVVANHCNSSLQIDWN